MFDVFEHAGTVEEVHVDAVLVPLGRFVHHFDERLRSNRGGEPGKFMDSAKLTRARRTDSANFAVPYLNDCVISKN